MDEFFTGTVSRLGGVSLDQLADEVQRRHRDAYPANPAERAYRTLDVGGEYQWRREGEHHLFNPETVFKLQHASRAKRYDVFKEYTSLVDDQARTLATLRGLFRFDTESREPISIDEVEPIGDIIKRFSTGAMSYGSISAEAHETLAIAMNRLGARSNTGEGGEDPERFVPLPNGDSRRSAVKQVASGRFGVTSEYLVNADDLQIKMAQGAKPGEGGQLPGHKVYPWIAKTRHSTPGVGLISPPPHHDIYSIEDLAQLIHDLKNANPAARVHVKLVAEVGVGTVAAGVSKAHADVVLISGHDGGTGASPLTSLKHAGAPWELGLAETQQTLLLNDLRDRIVVQVDGQMKTGRDVVIAALLGAEEFGFATAPLVVSGCVMMRVCHLDTCPVGVATQNPELRQRFNGQAGVRRELLRVHRRRGARDTGRARIPIHRRGDRTQRNARHPRRHRSLEGVGARSHAHPHHARCSRGPDALPDPRAGSRPRQRARQRAHRPEPNPRSSGARRSRSTCRSATCTARSARCSVTSSPSATAVRVCPTTRSPCASAGPAGQSFGAFVPRGITMYLEGDANDYTGKGLSGGRLVIHPHAGAPFAAEGNIIAGNVILYGATGGEMFLRGQVGERFAVRNSGAIAVVEGVGDHGCEYMTGGRVVVLGPTGRNFGAGMSGGIAYVLDADATFASRVNYEMVDLDPLDDDDRTWLRDRVHAPPRRNRLHGGVAVARHMG